MQTIITQRFAGSIRNVLQVLSKINSTFISSVSSQHTKCIEVPVPWVLVDVDHVAPRAGVGHEECHGRRCPSHILTRGHRHRHGQRPPRVLRVWHEALAADNDIRPKRFLPVLQGSTGSGKGISSCVCTTVLALIDREELFRQLANTNTLYEDDVK